jgi:hypothetical protein
MAKPHACYPLCGSGLNRESYHEMKKALCGSVLAAWTLLIGGAALSADQFGSAEEARAMLDRAVTALKTNKVAALKAFNDEKNKNLPRPRPLYLLLQLAGREIHRLPVRVDARHRCSRIDAG